MKFASLLFLLLIGMAFAANAQQATALESRILKHDGPQLVIAMPDVASTNFIKQHFAAGTEFVISKPLGSSNPNLQLTGWMNIARVRVVAMDPVHGSCTVVIREEMSDISVNGQRVDHFAPETPLRLSNK